MNSNKAVTEFRHAGLVVENLEQMLQFYVNVLGMTVVKRSDEDENYIGKVLGLKRAKLTTVKMFVDDPRGGLLELLYFPERKHKKKHLKIYPNSPGFTHIALTVKDVDKLFEKLKKKGIKFLSRPQKSPDGYARIVFCKDPEGNIVELVQLL